MRKFCVYSGQMRKAHNLSKTVTKSEKAITNTHIYSKNDNGCDIEMMMAQPFASNNKVAHRKMSEKQK